MVLRDIRPSDRMLRAALAYAARGWRVVPIEPGGKSPAIGGRGWLAKATTDAEQVRTWWAGREPAPNIGIVCDRAFGFVLDLDDARIRDFLPSFGPTLEARTPRGGQHIIFRHPPDLVTNAVKGLRAWLTARGYVPPQGVTSPPIDIRGPGGQIVVAPSVRADLEGTMYRWHNVGTPIAEAPAELLEAIRYQPPRAAPAAAAEPRRAPGELDGYQRAALEGEARKLAAMTAKKGSGRGKALFAAAAALGGLGVGLDDVRRALMPACEANGLVATDEAWHVEHELRRGWETGAATPRERPAPRERSSAPPSSAPIAPPSAAPPTSSAPPPRPVAAAPRTSAERRPVVRMGTDLHVAIDAGVQALRADADLYQRDGALVRVVRIAEPEPMGHGRGTLPAGMPQIREVAAATLRERLTRAARWERYDSRTEEWADAVPTDHIVHAIAARGEWPGLRPLVAFSETPIVRPDLSIVSAAGYDPVTGCIYLPSCKLPPIPPRPTRDDAIAALELLAEPFEDFPYRGDADRVVPVAAILTMLARSAIAGAVPACVLDASTRGSGKSLQADVIATIATGRAAPRMSWPGDDTELEKVLGAYALRGASLVALDNITTPFGGGPLDRVLTTQDTVELRVLGRSEIPALRWRAVVIATGNNVEVVGDTTRRVLVARLEPQDGSPEDRTDFRHPDLLGWVRAERPRLVVAALTVIRAWELAGRPQGDCRKWGSFEAWSQMIPPMLVWAGVADPMTARIGDADDGERRTLRGLLAGLEAIAPEEGLTVRELLEQLYPPHTFPPPVLSPAHVELREVLEQLVPTRDGKAPTTDRVGKMLRSRRGRYVDGRRLDAVPGRGGVMRWRVKVGLGV